MLRNTKRKGCFGMLWGDLRTDCDLLMWAMERGGRWVWCHVPLMLTLNREKGRMGRKRVK